MNCTKVTIDKELQFYLFIILFIVSLASDAEAATRGVLCKKVFLDIL